MRDHAAGVTGRADGSRVLVRRLGKRLVQEMLPHLKTLDRLIENHTTSINQKTIPPVIHQHFLGKKQKPVWRADFIYNSLILYIHAYLYVYIPLYLFIHTQFFFLISYFLKICILCNYQQYFQVSVTSKAWANSLGVLRLKSL